MPKNFKRGHTWASKKKKILPKLSGNRIFKMLPAIKWNKNTIIKNVILILVAVFLFSAILFLGMFAWLSRDLPDPNSLNTREVAQSTKIYDRTGEHLLYEIAGDEKRTLVTLDQIPDYLEHATITAEDRKFYEHSGIDYLGILRAVFFNVATLDPTGQGGSTITQQLVKNAILTNEKTYTRKIKELILALALERRYTKDEILQLYLNEIPYGSRNYGIESASQSYFGKPVENLSLAEAATLASIPKAPTMFLNNPERLEQRRNWVLESMVELEYITQAEAEAAKTEDTAITLNISGIEAPHFVLWVKEQLEEIYTQRTVEQGGLTVITSLDYDIQTYAEEAVENNRGARGESYGFNNSGLVAINPKTGEILAMVGSADYFNDEIDGQVNVTMRPLQPGSSFKPIVYTAGFERGYTPNTILWDVATTHPTPTGNYSPMNYDLGERGPITIRSALQGSLNIPAVKMLYLVGIESGLSFAERLHYSTFTDRSRFGLAVVLGGAEVKLLEHVGAYGVFATEGVYHEPVSILKVESADGEMLEEWEVSDGEKVLDSNIARMTSSVLSDDSARAPFFGAGSYLTLPGRPVATKTGTTNDYKDAWTIGYTPSLVAGVWTGNTDGSAMNRGSDGSLVAAPIWNEFMRKALEGTAVEGFTAPTIPVTGKAILDGNIPAELVVIDTASGKLATDRTPERFREEKICGQYHTILHFVTTSDPLGAAPEEPSDPYYDAWESGVQAYIERYNSELEEGEAPLEICDIPEEEDDVHVGKNDPSLTIQSPNKNDDVERTFDVQIQTDAPLGISRIEYKIDDSFVAIDTDEKGTTLTLPSWVGMGSHTLTVVSYDVIDNFEEKSVQITVTEAGSGGNFTITNPFSAQVIEKTQDTYQVVVELAGSTGYSKLWITAQNVWTGTASTVGEASSPGAITAIDWALPEAAQYLLVAHATDASGNQIDSEPVAVSVEELAESGGLSLVGEDTEE
ncbi:MAG: PBP1A family penicillin-binding protein [Candidatus Uhrbacteria bacterium]|nr:PBP1A family penicillin-binding protein [Candidatus Uhrbacteria bacterium]